MGASEAMLAVTIGIFATGLLDIFSVIMWTFVGTPKTEWRLVGRWFLSMKNGRFIHDHISKSPQIQGELAFGWIMHYVIGAAWSLIYFYLVYEVMGVQPTLLSASVFGLTTLVVPYCIQQPAMGHGFFAQKHPRPVVMPILSFLSHLTFGQALFLVYVLAGYLFL